MKFILVIFLLCNILQAYNIDQILDLYRKDSDLSNKTKNEALGHVTIYTRDDLERMQAYRLSDLMKTHHFVRYDENMLGLPDFIHEDPIPYQSDLIHIFINEHEISSAFTGSGLFLFGNIDLGFVDHIEIYNGVTSNRVSSEPAAITIKLYTKDPLRESGASLQMYGGSHDYNHINGSYASVEDLSVYVYASRTDGKREKFIHDTHTISRDFEELHFLFSLEHETIKIDTELISHKVAPFLSMSISATPREGELEYFLGRIGFSTSFFDETLLLTAAFSRIDERADLATDGGRWFYDESFGASESSLYLESLDDVFDMKLEKTQILGGHTLIGGAQWRSKKLHDVLTYNDGIIDDVPEFVDTQIASLFLQDDYLMSDNHLITASTKVSHYSNRSNRHDETYETFQARLGYIFNAENILFKSFLSHTEMPTEQYLLAISASNTIEVIDINNFSMEFSHTLDKHHYSLLGQYTSTQLPSQTAMIDTDTSKIKTYGISAKYDYNFDAFNSFESMFCLNNLTSSIYGDLHQSHNGYLRFLNSWGKWDLFNELNYFYIRDSQTDGIDYSAALRYKVTPDLIFSLKGSNIFNSAAKSRYSYVNTSKLIPYLGSLYYSPIDQLITLGMEYRF